ncbi:hypothetical protein Dsin_025313 [Dipteronia sinensis]|uniref:Uncharacterized protein n=1 Tax=Dipteronia sinensis TaxID=43782 RepID=A0AAD9ZX10_9ROSI|nr:hypothetical protein Dsin_025313 [Dipteronia sinensis]
MPRLFFDWFPSRKSKNEELNAPLLEGSKQQKSSPCCYNVYRFWSDLLNGLFSWFCFMKAKTGKKKKTTGKKKKKKTTTTSVVLVPLPTVVDDEYLEHVDKSRRFLRVLIGINHCELDMIKLALLDASSYDCNSQAGGPNTSIRFGDEYQYCCASGLKKCLDVCACWSSFGGITWRSHNPFHTRQEGLQKCCYFGAASRSTFRYAKKGCLEKKYIVAIVISSSIAMLLLVAVIYWFMSRTIRDIYSLVL